MPSDLLEKYTELEKNFFTAIDESEIEVFNAAALSMKLRQFLQGAVYTDSCGNFKKIHTIKLALLDQLLETNAHQPILAVINFRFEYELMKKRFKNPPIIYGKTSSNEKRKYIDKWNNGKIPLLLCHPASISHGLNLQTGGHIIVWMSLPWSLDQYQQLNGRLHRSGQKNGVIVNYLLFKDTVDEAVEKVLKGKNKTQTELLKALKEYRIKKK